MKRFIVPFIIGLALGAIALYVAIKQGLISPDK